MKRILIAVAVLAVLAPTAAMAKKVTYIYDNHRFNFVRLEEIKPAEAVKRGMTHPVQLDEQGVRAALASINLARAYVIKKEVDTQQVFTEAAVNFLAPNLVQAFSKARENEQVGFSYLSKEPIFILRNDRLSIASAWVTGNELHIKFDKLYAKITGDTDKRGNEGKAASSAQGLRVKLEMMPGQKMGIDDPEEVVLDLNYNYAADLIAKEKAKNAPPAQKTMAGETVAPAGEAAGGAAADAAATTATPAEGKKAKKSKSEAAAEKNAQASAAAATGTAAASASSAVKSPQERLQTLEQLKKDGLITKKEYEAKKQEILKDL